MENYISISHWGMFQGSEDFPDIELINMPDLSAQFREGWEAALGIEVV